MNHAFFNLPKNDKLIDRMENDSFWFQVTLLSLLISKHEDFNEIWTSFNKVRFTMIIENETLTYITGM